MAVGVHLADPEQGPRNVHHSTDLDYQSIATIESLEAVNTEAGASQIFSKSFGLFYH